MSEYQSGYAVAADRPSAGDQSVVAQAQEKVQEKAQQATGVVAQKARTQVESGAGRASAELRSVAQAMRRSGHALHADGRSSAKVVDGATDRIEQLATYLGETNGDRMLQDVESFGRRQPWAMIGIGVAMGFVASRFLKASSTNRYDVSMSTAGRTMAPSTTVAPHVAETPVLVTDGHTSDTWQ
jgi:ElaB/YqjD/DUF883 family membrane-anchored ribosome-binding protein